jgi:hypothetical protein
LNLRLLSPRRETGTRPHDLREKTNAAGCFHCKKRGRLEQSKESTPASKNAYIGVAAVLLHFCIHVCFTPNEKLAHMRATFMRRPMKRGPSTEKDEDYNVENKSKTKTAFL